MSDSMTARRITPEDILDLLPIVAGEDWRMEYESDGGAAIRNLWGECPMCALWREIGGEHGALELPLTAARRLGFALDGPTIHAVMVVAEAADHSYSLHRARLMAALEMTR